jgi:hypothetical protein
MLKKSSCPWPQGELAEPRQAHHAVNQLKTLNLILNLWKDEAGSFSVFQHVARESIFQIF